MFNITKTLQQQLDACGPKGGVVITPKGEYIIGALFIPSNVEFEIAAETILYGSEEITDYPEIETRIAGIDMKWPAAIINVLDADNVKISGEGTINGRGSIWWEKFWGTDEQSGMMADYISRGLRWAVDYDCKRPRNVLVFRSSNVVLKEFNSIQSGFWNTQITYSEHVLVDGISVRNSKGPSTDGIDIDSCRDVVVQNTYVECNDDNICVKAGRGREAFEGETKCQNITIQNCRFGKGSGVTLGSETSGGIEDITIKNILFDQTGVGFRIKSANNRGGYIRGINVADLTMKDVQFPFMLQTNWYPEYSYAEIPADHQGEVPDYWGKLLAGVSDKLGCTEVRDLQIENVIAETTGAVRSRAFFIEGNEERPITGLSMMNIQVAAVEFGKIAGVRELALHDVVITAPEITQDENDTYER